MKLTIADLDVAEPAGSHPGPCRPSEGARVGPVLEGGSLRAVVVALQPGQGLDWPAVHGEEVAYVLHGRVDADGTSVEAGGSVILHAGGPYALTAERPSRLALFWDVDGAGAPDDGGPASGDRAVAHVIGPEGWARSGSPGASMATWFADSTCEGCDVTFMKVARDTPGNRGRAHTHSADEIILVVEGEISFGAHRLPAGTAAHVPADTRYAVTCGPTGHAFLNYRATGSTQQYEGDPEPVPETALGRGGSLVAEG